MSVKELVVERGLIETEMIEKAMMDNPQPSSCQSCIERLLLIRSRISLWALSLLFSWIILLE